MNSSTTPIPTGGPIDIEHLIRYLLPITSAFGLVITIIHSYFLSRILGPFPIFICSMVATVSNFLMFTVRLIMETVSIIIKIYHVNCSGYVNLVDLIFKSTSGAFYAIADNVEEWMLVSMCFVQVFAMKNVGKEVWDRKTSTTVSYVTVSVTSLLTIVQLLSLSLVAAQLTYSECDTTNLFETYLKHNQNWIIAFQEIMKYTVVFSSLIQKGLFIFFIFHFLKLQKVSKEADKKNNCKLIIWLILSHLLTSMVAILANSLIFGEHIDKTSEELILSSQLLMAFSQIGAACRPFIFLIVSTEYRKTVKSFFIITAYRPSVVSIQPASPVPHYSGNRNSNSGLISVT